MNPLAAHYCHIDTGLLLEGGNTYQPVTQVAYNTTGLALFFSFAIHNQNKQKIGQVVHATTRYFELWYNYNNDNILSFVVGGSVYPTGLTVENDKVVTVLCGREWNSATSEYDSIFYINSPQYKVIISGVGVFGGGGAAAYWGDPITANNSSMTLIVAGFSSSPSIGMAEQAIRYIHNNGRGIKNVELLNKKWGWTIYRVNQGSMVGNQYGDTTYPYNSSGLLRFTAPRYPQEHKVVTDADREKYYPIRQLNKVTRRSYTRSQRLKDYIFENSSFLLNTYSDLKGAFMRADSASTDLPGSWNGSIDITGNKWGGETAEETTVSIITKVSASNFTANNQTPAGYDNCYFQLARDIIGLSIENARKKKFILTTENNALYNITNRFSFSNNALEQTLIELLNFPYTKIKVIYGTNPGTNLSGPIPQMDNYTAEMRVTNASLTVLPDSLPMSTIDLSGNILQGTCKAPSVVNCWLSGQKAGSDFTIDLSIHTAASIAFLDIYNNAGKLKGINLPANKNVTVRFYGYLNDFPEFEWPAGFTVTGLFYMYSMTNWQNHIFPLGINIKSSTIRIDNNGMTESAVNGTVDSWLDNQAGFSGVEIVKTLMLHGNNAALTNLGRATRKQEVQQAIESNNWILYINDSVSSTYFRIEGIVSVAGSATDIIVQFNSAPNASAGTYSISNTVNFDGMDWSYVSKGTDANATNNSNGVFVRLTKVGFNNSGKASETGTIKKN